MQVIKYNPNLPESVISAVIESFLYDTVSFDGSLKTKKKQILKPFKIAVHKLKKKYQELIINAQKVSKKEILEANGEGLLTRSAITDWFRSIPNFMKVDHPPFVFYAMENTGERFDQTLFMEGKRLYKVLGDYEFDLTNQEDFDKVVRLLSTVFNTKDMNLHATLGEFNYIDKELSVKEEEE